jgi:hypothetical protein
LEIIFTHFRGNLLFFIHMVKRHNSPLNWSKIVIIHHIQQQRTASDHQP